MLKKTLSAVAVAAAVLTVGAAVAAETNPLHPSYPTFAAAIDFGASQGAVEIAKNPLTPSYYQWNVATVTSGSIIEIYANNPLHPSFKRS
jgi:hypothetical protein